MSTDAAKPPTTDAAPEFPLFDIEAELGKLNSLGNLVLHMSQTAHELDGDDLIYIADLIIGHHDNLDAAWKRAWEQDRARVAAHEAEQAKLQAKERASPAAAVERLEALRRLLQSAAKLCLDNMEATVAGTGWPYDPAAKAPV